MDQLHLAKQTFGFKLIVQCKKCGDRQINSCPLIGDHAYEINQRIVVAMRVIGVGWTGLSTFCGLMDLPKCISNTFYNTIKKYIMNAAKTVANSSMNRAAVQEREMTVEKDGNNERDYIAVSGDGTWQKRGFSSLHGVSSLIGVHTGKVIDVIVKSSICKICQFLNEQEECSEILAKKEHAENCEANHEGSAGNMEVSGVVEMFSRSMENYGLKYMFYIGAGDSKTYKGIVDAKPYGDEIPQKRECIGHVKKRMGNRLRNKKKEEKGLGGKGKLTAKLIDELQTYYGLAIQRNCHSVKAMKDAVYATFYHKISTNENPQHHLCPIGADSWCQWQKAKALSNLSDYKHNTPLHPDVEAAIKPIYEELSNEKLLERCLGGFTQNSNGSFNSTV